jgi:accessory gene regulator protein AgrB
MSTVEDMENPTLQVVVVKAGRNIILHKLFTSELVLDFSLLHQTTASAY